MRLMMRAGVLFLLTLLLVTAGFAKSPAKSKAKKHPKNAADTPASSTTNNSAEPSAAASPAKATAAYPAQGAAGKTKSRNSEEVPKFIPMLATTGTIGLFSVETGETLPRHGFAFSAYGNKFSRQPGSVSILSIGLDASYGLTNWLTIYGKFEPYVHSHVGNEAQLSLAPPNNAFQQFPGSIYHRLPSTGFPGYVEDYPFVARNDGGVGTVTLGFKIGLLSERRGNRVSLSFRNDVNFPTRTGLSDLLANGTQTGEMSDEMVMTLSKQWGSVATTTVSAGYRFVPDPKANGITLLESTGQFRPGAGILLFPESRIQPMMEASAVVFTKDTHTPDSTFGARDPVDGVWGVRLYATRHLAIDLGYRYMLNLKGAHDRNGFVVKVGTAYWPEKAPPPPPNGSPVASCSADKSMVYVGSDDTVTVSAMASDPDNDPLTYTWSATGGRVDGSGPTVRWMSMGTTPGSYTVSVKVDDGRGGSASCGADVRVEVRPNHPPTITCSANPNSVFAGERSHITCNASDPDNDPLTYTWRANAGQITGNGSQGDFDTTGLSPGNYTITTRVDDGRGGAADASTGVTVKPTPIPPQASKINECAFGRAQSARIDNVCKRILDDVALRLQNEPRATTVIIGYSDPKERGADKIAGDRASNTVKYLGEKGIDASRVKTRTGSGQAGATNNRRAEIIWVPEGATY